MQQQIVRRRVIRTASAPAPAPAPTPVKEQVAVAAPVRRTMSPARRVNNRVDNLQYAEQTIKTALLKVKEADEAIDRAQEEKEALFAQIEVLMKENRLSYQEAAGYEALLKEEFTKQQTVIDAKKFRAKVDADTFWRCVKVNVGDAKEHLAEKEVLGIADIKKAESRGVLLTVQEKKKSKR